MPAVAASAVLDPPQDPPSQPGPTTGPPSQPEPITGPPEPTTGPPSPPESTRTLPRTHPPHQNPPLGPSSPPEPTTGPALPTKTHHWTHPPYQNPPLDPPSPPEPTTDPSLNPLSLSLLAGSLQYDHRHHGAPEVVLGLPARLPALPERQLEERPLVGRGGGLGDCQVGDEVILVWSCKVLWSYEGSY